MKMKKQDLTKEQFLSVQCATCGVAAGEPCVWGSGEIHLGPHLNRKLSALELMEREKSIDNINRTGSSQSTVDSVPLRNIPLR